MTLHSALSPGDLAALVRKVRLYLVAHSLEWTAGHTRVLVPPAAVATETAQQAASLGVVLQPPSAVSDAADL